MQLATILYEAMEQPVLLKDDEVILIRDLNQYIEQPFPLSLIELVDFKMSEQLQHVVSSLNDADWAKLPKLEIEELHFVAPYRNPQYIFGVGMNYVEKAENLKATPIENAPVCFLKPTASLIGMNEAIELPSFSEEVTAEGELSLIIGKTCHQVDENEAMSYVSAYTTSLDMTAKDIHSQNPRFIQMSKLFKSFFSFGPQVNLLKQGESLSNLTVSSVQNGEVKSQNTIDNMVYSPALIVSYISQFVTLQPGDIIMTGTPGSFVLQAGDIASCHITGFQTLSNEVM
jgi:2-keto-4-pentenoate hydratase/2-oxohepta-3-ene-1,7-dioic acid hydratase in catechol pathway